MWANKITRTAILIFIHFILYYIWTNNKKIRTATYIYIYIHFSFYILNFILPACTPSLHKLPAPHKKRQKTKTDVKYQDQETTPLNKPFSPKSLRERGAAVLQAFSKNHHIDIPGIKFIKPLLINKLGSSRADLFLVRLYLKLCDCIRGV
jgi:hypothetical protein